MNHANRVCLTTAQDWIWCGDARLESLGDDEQAWYASLSHGDAFHVTYRTVRHNRRTSPFNALRCEFDGRALLSTYQGQDSGLLASL